ncbi:MAG: MFS transporter [Verrucomicrobia bacterium]|nr:MAG: MFS transporter [Verrucomicrobiota bacterium]
MNADDLSGNPRRYVTFTVFYNARAYYPVLAILFLDLGLTLDQFVMLNLVWAATIFLFEVPSGALADTLGRRTLLIAASFLMVLEMSLLLLAPRDGGAWLWWMCVANRICSGLSEAFASGADEALAYDSLPDANKESSWDQVLGTAMRWRSVGFVVAMILGSMTYDPRWWNEVAPAALEVSKEFAQRIPTALVLMQAIACVWISWRMVEPRPVFKSSWKTAFIIASIKTIETAKRVVVHPQMFAVIMIGVCIDGVVRNVATLTSSYYRLIDLPEWTFGFIGAAIGLLNWFVPSVAKALNQRFSTFGNLLVAGLLAVAALALLTPAWPIFGLLPVMMAMMTLGYLSFTISRALHREAESAIRATVLSVKGLIFNLGYGTFSFLFAKGLAQASLDESRSPLQTVLIWQAPLFALLLAGIFLWGWRQWNQPRHSNDQ